MHADIWFDGASRGNPGPMAGGAIVVLDGERRVVYGARGHGTNNEAEYQGLLAGLHAARAAGATSVHIRGDSQLIIRQLEGRYQVKAPKMKPLYEQAKQALADFTTVRFTWVPRAENADADQAANDALDR